MTRDDIIRMARDAGFDESNAVCAVVVRHSNGSWVGIEERLALFADLVAAAERTGVHHHALSDAEAQAAHLLRMLDSDLTPAHRSCNACDWSGPVSECVMLGSVGPLCPDCRETTDTVDTAGDAKQ